MSCPTCDHAMQKVSESVFWCPRCGTLAPNWEAAEAPKLVERCRKFQTTAMIDAKDDVSVKAISLWVRLGITESINVPADRPPV